MDASRATESAQALVLVGATAVGKSAVAAALAARGPSTIVSLDARQVYRGLDIGTAKPTDMERAAVGHRGVDERNPDDPWSAGQAGEDGRRWVEEARAERHWPIVVAGSGLYVQSLLAGFDRGAVDPAQRAMWDARLREEGLGPLVMELTERSPALAGRTDLDNPRRVMRALEWLDAGIAVEDRLEDRQIQLPVVGVQLTLERTALVRRIDARVERMFQEGLVEETRALVDRWGAEVLDRIPTVGYDQVRAHLRGDLSLDEAVEAVKVATRRFARRQATWFRKYGGFQEEEIHEGERLENIATRVFDLWECQVGSSPWGR